MSFRFLGLFCFFWLLSSKFCLVFTSLLLCHVSGVVLSQCCLVSSFLSLLLRRKSHFDFVHLLNLQLLSVFVDWRLPLGHSRKESQLLSMEKEKPKRKSEEERFTSVCHVFSLVPLKLSLLLHSPHVSLRVFVSFAFLHNRSDVVFHGVKIMRQTNDICDYVQCPLSPGPVSVKRDFTVPVTTPSGPYSIEVHISDQDGKDLLCVDIAITLNSAEPRPAINLELMEKINRRNDVRWVAGKTIDTVGCRLRCFFVCPSHGSLVLLCCRCELLLPRQNTGGSQAFVWSQTVCSLLFHRCFYRNLT